MAVILRFGILAVCVWSAVAALAWARFTLPPAIVGGRTAAAPVAQLAPGLQDRDKVVEAIKRKALWATETMKAEDLKPFVGPPQPVLWSHIATVVSAKERYVLLRSASGEVKTIKEHELLPSGELLVAVNVKSVTVRSRSGKNTEIKTYAD